jgi:acyl-CoA thioesterase-1
MSRRRTTTASSPARTAGLVLLATVTLAIVALIAGTALNAQRSDVTSTSGADTDSGASVPPPVAPSAGGPSVTVARPADRPLQVAFAGDSLTYGLFASSEDAGYRPRVITGLEASGPVRWSSGGEIGNTIETVTSIIDFPETADLAILALGTNDVVRTPADRIPAIYDALMRKVRNSAPGAAVICLGVWSDAAGRRDYDAPIQASCRDGGGTFVSLESVYETPGTRGPAGKQAFGGISDDFHPNDAGYEAIAELVLSRIDVR